MELGDRVARDGVAVDGARERRRDATSGVLRSLQSGIAPLDGLAHALGGALAGDGFAVAIACAVASAAIGLGVVTRRRPHLFLAAAVAINLVYWFLGQGFGLIFAGGATDPNAGPLFCLLALAMLPSVAPVASDGERLAVGQQLREEPLARRQEAARQPDRAGVLVVDGR